MGNKRVAEQKQKGKQSEFVRWFAPLLQALKDLGGSAAPREASARVAEIEKVPDALRNQVLRTGQERFHNQVCWARQYLVWDGLIDSGKRGVWSLTPKGVATQLDANSAREIFLGQVRQRAVIRKPSVAAVVSTPDSNDKPEDTPQADEDASLESFLRVLKGLSPNGFERLSAEKGIFLTTSSFTSNARAEAERPAAAPIELVDREKLFEMFKRYKLGLKPRTVFDIGLVFFEQFR
ncbi:MAG: winged helix-turn-helix domain-containing protein [Candidatus Saccharibacteria bacterium]|nr:winged helix-turn-helix domain-containing protein [Rhodoferax sp.]